MLASAAFQSAKVEEVRRISNCSTKEIIIIVYHQNEEYNAAF